MSNKQSADKNIVYLLRYSTSHLSKTDRVRFFYALKGRDGKSGVLRATRSQFLAKSVLLVPKEAFEEIKDFLRFWRCKFEAKRVDLKPKRADSAIFVYDTSGLKKSQLVRFYYALKGRDGKSGVLRELEATAIARSVVLVGIKQAAELEDFFRFWNVPVKKMEVAVQDE